jgi:Gpi18-like mannosyltransferase
MTWSARWLDSARTAWRAFAVSRLFLLAVVAIAAGPVHSLRDTVLVWDGGWYLHIASHGYSTVPFPGTEYSTLAFFPAWPLLVRVLGGNVWTAVATANLLFLASLAMLHRLLALDLGPQVAARATWLLAFFPASIVCSTAYSEPLFLAAVLGAFLCLRDDRAVGFGLLAALASATRPEGFVLALVAADVRSRTGSPGSAGPRPPCSPRSA